MSDTGPRRIGPTLAGSGRVNGDLPHSLPGTGVSADGRPTARPTRLARGWTAEAAFREAPAGRRERHGLRHRHPGPDRRITNWSPGARAIFGYEGQDVLGRTGDLLFTREDRAAGEPEEEAGKSLREGRAADERWHVREDGFRFYASGVLTPLGDGWALGFVKVLRNLTDRKRMEDDLQRAGHELELRVSERPTALDDIGLAPALSAYVARWTERTGIAADFRPLGHDEGRLPPEVETTVYRVVQEALNNVAKHACARRVSVIAARRRGELTALVEDDGQGFDPGRVGWESGGRSLGLLGMRERLGLVGGTLAIDSGDGEGTTVRATIPLDQPATDAELVV